MTNLFLPVDYMHSEVRKTSPWEGSREREETLGLSGDGC